MKKREALLEAIALVHWDGKKFVETDQRFHNLLYSQKLAVESKADYIIKVLQVTRKLYNEEVIR